jgi:cytochrome b561
MRLPPWVTALIILVVAGYAVPYLLLANNETWSGAFLFWMVFGLVVWGILVGRVARWNVEAAPPPPADRPGARP